MGVKSAMPISDIEGTVRSDNNTKRLLRSIRRGEIALIRHADLDEPAAEGLLLAGVKAVVNAARTMTGKFPHEGPLCLLRAGVPVLEIGEEHFEAVRDGETAMLSGGMLAVGHVVIPYRTFGSEEMIEANRLAEWNFGRTVIGFAENTLHYAHKELDMLLKPLSIPPLCKKIEANHVLIVSRGKGYKEDLAALRDYISEAKPVLIGVDGGADALTAQGYGPDFIIGDMDSVSDETLHLATQLLVHAYMDGRAPGLERIRRLGLRCDTIAAPGTSEDVAMRIAFEQEAAKIVIVGSHSQPVDFLEKGRAGMSSTLLVRMMVGHKLVDAKGASLWMQPKKPLLHIRAGLAIIQ
ncbi:MAG: thiamine pyrophosphokinae catalytic protein [Paenibacillus sp.]|nr:thiamine pyrophosphokinae catalytic protein [Paenibacillus sp.]